MASKARERASGKSRRKLIFWRVKTPDIGARQKISDGSQLALDLRFKACILRRPRVSAERDGEGE